MDAKYFLLRIFISKEIAQSLFYTKFHCVLSTYYRLLINEHSRRHIDIYDHLFSTHPSWYVQLLFNATTFL
jgi:hypothetical protein